LPHSHATARTRCNLGNGRECPLVVHYWVDLQSVHGFRFYVNIHLCKLIALYTANGCSAEREMLVSACKCSVAGFALLALWREC